MGAIFRFRRFRTRLVVLVLGLVAAALTLTFQLITRANRASAISHIEQRLTSDVRVFWYSVRLRQKALTDTARVVSADWPIRTLYLQDTLDRDTLRSTLFSYANRLNTPVLAAFSNSGEMLATTASELSDEHCGPFRYLVHKADDEALDDTSDFALLSGRLHVLIVVPLYAPKPNIIGWLGVAFPIDDKYARDFKATTQAEVSFTTVNDQGHGDRVLATTLPSQRSTQLLNSIPTQLGLTPLISITSFDREPFVSLFTPLPLLGDDPARIALQRSLDAELAPARELENLILLISLAALAAASIIAFGLARGISGPVQRLAEATRTVARGDYTCRLELNRSDELGQLAHDFNQMTAGLAERDRVRDLLGKVVSPEIATQLLHSELKLGGEEREVTILFSDLRNFTSLGEKLPPTQLLALLNRYLDRMSTIIEKHGGVVDKYIGDAIMALFGAPVAAPDAAARALAAAREMLAALEELNRELAAEGHLTLACGIGINTAHVVAGNMGSRTRLNYTVIGDGVNLAARLESLTKDSTHAANIIVSESTADAAGAKSSLRPLGKVTVKGKSASVHIYAADL